MGNSSVIRGLRGGWRSIRRKSAHIEGEDDVTHVTSGQ